jgi:DNA-binding SARP family transcriptional activator
MSGQAPLIDGAGAICGTDGSVDRCDSGVPIADGRIGHVQIGMLGPFEVRTDNGVLVDVPGARLRGLLIALALEPGHVVSKSALVDWVWGERPPGDAANALQRLVSRLRKALPEGSVQGQPNGYRLAVEPDVVDAVRFERVVGHARDEGDPQRLREALGLWCGAAMQDVGLEDSAAFDAAAARLEALRLTAMEDRFDAEISLGHGEKLVTELTDLVAAHPLRERLVAALMRALVATGRDTEALLVYERTREKLADELGVSPSPELAALHTALLRGELGRREANRTTNLRAELTTFVGRDADLAGVRELMGKYRLITLVGPGGAGRPGWPRNPRVRCSATEKSLVLTDGDRAPRYRMLGTINEYASHRLAEAGESDRARRAHLAYFTELVETADPHLRRAEQLEWLATLEVEHENISAAMRGALAAGEAHSAMRLAAAAGWYWWLGGHKAEGNELIMAATATPGEVPDEIRATVYAFVVAFLTSGRGDEYHAEEWIHEAHKIGQRVRGRHPALRFAAPLEHLLQAPDASVPAFEPLLTDEDPWVRALARLHLGRMRILLGQDGQDADAHLETALTEFRALGERWGISFALTELADRIAMRGEFAGACASYEQAIAVVTEVGAIEDVVRMRSRQAQLYWLSDDEESSAAAMAEAQRHAQRVAWPNALAELALSKAELARWSGDAEQAHRQLDVATAMLGGDAEQANVRAVTEDLLGYLAEDLDEAREHRVAAFAAASEGGHAPLIAQVIVGIADLALRDEQYEQSARLLAASAGVRGLPDRSQPDVARIEQAARRRVGDARFAEATREGTQTSWRRLVTDTLTA